MAKNNSEETYLEDTAFIEEIVRLAFSGGGACGIVYPGAYKALLEMGLFENVQILSGTSAGAATAALIATGMSCEIFRQKIHSTDLRTLMGTRIGTFLASNPQGITFITKDGAPLINFMRENIVESIRKRLFTRQEMVELAQVNPEFEQLLNKLTQEDQALAIEEIIETSSNFAALLHKLKAPNPIVTFSDLAILNRYFPKHFKQLVTAAARFPTGELQIFNHVITPDVEIAMACRASMSLPIILEPVEIDINGETYVFVDGGLIDNLPTNYFDFDTHGNFIPNQKPKQTLLFTFASDYTDAALYGHRWDEAEITQEKTLVKILTIAIENVQTMLASTEEEALPHEIAPLLLHAIEGVLASPIELFRETDGAPGENNPEVIEQRLLSPRESEVIMTAMRKAIKPLSQNPHHHPQFWQEYYRQEMDEHKKILLLAQYLKQCIKPYLLHNLSYLEIFKRDYAVSVLGDLKTHYKNTVQMETKLQKIRQEYPLRTVNLYVGDINTTDFNKATRLARLMDVMGYLDTIGYVTNHELHNKKMFDESQFYWQLIDSFAHIYSAVLVGSGQAPQTTCLNQRIEALKIQLHNKPTQIINREIYQLIKEQVEQDPDSIEAFALTRAVEFYNKKLGAEDLFKEIYEEAFKRTGFFSLSNITRHTIFRQKTLHEALQKQNMFALLDQQESRETPTRANKIFTSLVKIQEFKDDYAQQTTPETGLYLGN